MVRVAYLGPEKTNTHFAARKKFGAKAGYVHAPTVEDVFRLVERGQADFGVVPIENSLEGAVAHTLDQFAGFRASSVRIWGELEMPIRHCLIVLPGVEPRGVSVVYSHPQALAQCRGWLHKHLPRASLVETLSTADAVHILLERNTSVMVRPDGASKVISVPERNAAIGREDLAKDSGLKAIAIPQDRENKTRFLVISRRQPLRSRRSKTSLLFALKDRPGALHDALVPFKEHRINLTKIESRPTKRKAWEYVFFVDFNGHISEPRVRQALKDLKRSAEVQVLGSYPAGGKG